MWWQQLPEQWVGSRDTFSERCVKCCSCSLRERHLERFRDHLKRAHQSDVTIRCGRCEYESTKRSDLTRHYRRQHKGREAEAEYREFKETSLCCLGRRMMAGNRRRAREVAQAIGREACGRPMCPRSRSPIRPRRERR